MGRDGEIGPAVDHLAGADGRGAGTGAAGDGGRAADYVYPPWEECVRAASRSEACWDSLGLSYRPVQTGVNVSCQRQGINEPDEIKRPRTPCPVGDRD